MKLFAFNNGGYTGWYQALAIGEDGKVYAEHICSHECFVPGDLGADGRSDWQHDNYNKAFGVGNWEIEYISPDNIKTHIGLQAAIAKAKEIIAKGEETIQCERAGATVTFSDSEGKEHEKRVGFE